LSDRAAKDGVVPVDGRMILAKVASLPLATWRYRTQDESVRHIGPMAQDFRAVFGLGEDDTHISTVDADGVALAAIQGLYTVVKEKDDEIATLRGELTAMKAQQQSASEELKAIRAQLAGQR